MFCPDLSNLMVKQSSSHFYEKLNFKNSSSNFFEILRRLLNKSLIRLTIYLNN